MQKKHITKKTRQLAVRFPHDVLAWVEGEARDGNTSVSAVLIEITKNAKNAHGPPHAEDAAQSD